MRGRAWLVIVLVACEKPAPLPALPSMTATSSIAPPPPAPSAIADAGADTAHAHETDVVNLVPPAAVACTVDPRDQSLQIAFDGTSSPFAWVSSAKGKLFFPRGPAARGAFLEHEDATLRVHGFVPRDTLRLFAKKPVTLGGFFVPRAAVALRWNEGEDQALVVEPIDDFFDSRATSVVFLEAPRSAVPCTDLAFGEAKEWNATTFALHGKRGTEVHLGTDPIPLSRSRGERPVAEVRFTYPDTAKAHLIEKHSDYAFVVIDAWQPAVLCGWIPSSMIVPKPGKLVGGHRVRAPALRMGMADGRDKRRVSCTTDVPIHVEQGNRHAIVGSIPAGSPFTYIVEARADGAHEALIPGLTMTGSALIDVMDGDVAACNTQPK